MAEPYTDLEDEIHVMFKAFDAVEPDESYDSVKLLIDGLAAKIGDLHPDVVRARNLVAFMED